MIVLAFIAAATTGTLLRAASAGLATSFSRRMWATLSVNLVGAFLLGLLGTANVDRALILGVAGLGSLTTFSTFISQIECISREGTRRSAACYALGTMIGGVCAAFAGRMLG